MIINHIDDILPAIKDKPEFIVMDKGDYKVVTYIYVDTHTFDDSRCLECRGLKFNAKGEVLSRGLGKFFNLFEKEQPEQIDWVQPHVITEKLDGSLITGCSLNDQLVLMTKAGITEVAEMAMARFLPQKRYQDFIQHCLNQGWTPNFEYTASDNRIILYYPEPALTLLAIRHIITGESLKFKQLIELSKEYNIPLVPGLTEPITDILQFIQHVRELKGKEGYVIHFDSGRPPIKIKADDYLLKHRAKSELDSRKKILHVVVRNGMDDLLPLLGPEDQTLLKSFAHSVYSEINSVTVEVADLVNRYGHTVDRKTFATKIVSHLSPWLKGSAFRHFDGIPAREAVINSILSRDGRSIIHEEYIKTIWDKQEIKE